MVNQKLHTHKTIFRPWGNYHFNSKGSNCEVKKIVVKPEQSLSLQMHKFRAEALDSRE